MYFDKDAFSTTEKVKPRPPDEAYYILENIDLSVSQYENHYQLCLQGSAIRNAYCLWVCRKALKSAKNLVQTIDEKFSRVREYQKNNETPFKNIVEVTPEHIKDQIKMRDWI